MAQNLRHKLLALLTKMADPIASGPQDLRDKRDWLRLLRSENVGPTTFLKLVRKFGSAANALYALPDLARRGGASRPLRVASLEEVDAEWIAGEDHGAKLVAIGEPDYPARLAHIPAAPPLIWVLGDTNVFQKPGIAIVGSRNASANGRRAARQFAAGLAEDGFMIASGFARGIDTAAHEASIETGTVAVFASGIGHIYPPENRELVARICEAGAIITERPPFAPPRSQDFPSRNRIISGLAHGVLIVEAAKRSGTLITARYALEQGRDVYALPGQIADPRAAGTNALLKDGAILVTEPGDITEQARPQIDRPIDDFSLREQEKATYDASEFEIETNKDSTEKIFDLLGPVSTQVDSLIRESNLSASTVQSVLIQLELAGRLTIDSGQGVRLLVKAK